MASIASGLGVIAVYRNGIHGLHGKSYLFLTLGLICWFSADVIILYYYYELGQNGLEELERVSVADGLWFAGYALLGSHLLFVIRLLGNVIKPKVVIGVSITTVIFIIYIVLTLSSSTEEKVRILTEEEVDIAAFLVNIAYPILDVVLLLPSAIIFISLLHDYRQFVPYLLSSLSLLINAIADDGYAVDIVNENIQNLWFWNLFFITDFIIMAGALVWYNKVQISEEIIKNEKTVRP